MAAGSPGDDVFGRAMSVSPWRRSRFWQLLAAITLAMWPGCKRTADAPLPRQTLFPDVVEHVAQRAEREMVRAELMTAVEPDGSRALARKIPKNVVVSGVLAAAPIADASSADGAVPAPKPRRHRRKHRLMRLDDDWFRLEGDPQAEQVTRVELRDAPRCARLDVFSTGKRPLRQATWHRGIRPVLPGLRLDHGPLWVRVRCLVRRTTGSAKPTAQGGAYRLAVSTRPRRPDEEREPNDVLSAETQVLKHGQTVQATLAPRNDVDVFRLDLSAAVPGAAQMLSVNGSPGVKLEVALIAEGSVEPMLVRRPPTGQGVLVPNLDVRRTGTHLTLRVASRRGQAPDAPYAATVRALMPGGCTDRDVCPAKEPVEREPNDTHGSAMGVKAGSLISGVLDGRGDEDWYAIDGTPGDVVQVRLRAPEGLAVALSVGDVGKPWVTLRGKPDGERVTLAGWRTSKRRVYVRVAGVDGAADATALYFLRVQFLSLPTFEQEGSQQALVDGPRPTRSGVLLPAGDVDSFSLDWTQRSAVTNVAFVCHGDGLPGLRCRLTDAAGATLARLSPPEDAVSTQTSLQLPPGAYTVTVDAEPARTSLAPYGVTIEDNGPVPAPLPTAVTASLRALLGGPESVAPTGNPVPPASARSAPPSPTP